MYVASLCLLGLNFNNERLVKSVENYTVKESLVSKAMASGRCAVLNNRISIDLLLRGGEIQKRILEGLGIQIQVVEVKTEVFAIAFCVPIVRNSLEPLQLLLN